ncbi:MAG: mitochondrial splicing system protein [Piccolia ochrophora]|nr:MAG: mitochondrial splicing system protein [Piccolia ochrophora]
MVDDDPILLNSYEPTIYALSTAPGRAAIAVIRVSGPACVEIYHALCPERRLPKSRYVALRTLYEPHKPATKDNVLDSDALVLYLPAPKTVTGDDVLELHVHGGSATVKAVLAAIPHCASPPGSSTSIRYADPGEFTRRAFLNDRLDLTQVEALSDTLSAVTEQQRRLSVRGTTSNSLSTQFTAWRTQLLHARAELEALIDFSEDQHFDESPSSLASSVASQVRALVILLRAHITNAVRGELLRNGIRLSLLGAPNAGKSSLLNRVVGRDAAIVSREAGTTRDVVEVGVDLDGWYCLLGDMAGLREDKPEVIDASPVQSAHDDTRVPITAIEQEGIARAKARALDSDVVIVVLAAERSAAAEAAPNPAPTPHLHLNREVTATAAAMHAARNNVLVAVNKVDLLRPASIGPNPAPPTAKPPSLPSDWLAAITAAIPGLPPSRIFPISCRDAPSLSSSSSSSCSTSHASKSSTDFDPGNIRPFLTGLTGLFESLTTPVTPSTSPSNSFSPEPDPDPSIWHESLGTTQRQRGHLESCLAHLEAFLADVDAAMSPSSAETRVVMAPDHAEIDLVVSAERLRAAAECLARITGRGVEAGDVEEVLGVVFEK